MTVAEDKCFNGMAATLEDNAASKLANSSVTLLLLDRIDIVRHAKQNHPFRVQKAAIDSGNEQHALEVAMHDKIQASIWHPELTSYRGSGAPTTKWTITSYTKAAVDQGMTDLVQVLNQFNRRKVSRAVWYEIHNLSCDGIDILTTMPRVLLRIGKSFTDAGRWKQVRDVYLARYGGSDKAGHLLACLPDDVFHRVVAFVLPPSFQHPSTFEMRCCDCDNLCV
ncbi:unnamed protein product [Phytophthora lilii]|uniref:Unnamed protein product n=1 Tax=Phytophthora lilii TaxID=2077276 RepID=A0A9W6TB66_9STRA|nr:unnamed protein product [Phytophthora lilii]